MPILLTLAAVGVGILIAVQPAMNAQLGRSLGNPFYGSMTNFTLGFLSLAVVGLTIVRPAIPKGAAISAAPWCCLLYTSPHSRARRDHVREVERREGDPFMRFRVTAIALSTLASAMTQASFAGPLNPPAGPVASTPKTLQSVEPRIEVNATNTPGDSVSVYIISQPGSYYLSDNIDIGLLYTSRCV